MTEHSALDAAHLHCRALQEALAGLRANGLPRIADWGGRLAAGRPRGGGGGGGGRGGRPPPP
ncbi:phosphoheptose isomerase, partial [Streptomyces pilosus]